MCQVSLVLPYRRAKTGLRDGSDGELVGNGYARLVMAVVQMSMGMLARCGWESSPARKTGRAARPTDLGQSICQNAGLTYTREGLRGSDRRASPHCARGHLRRSLIPSAESSLSVNRLTRLPGRWPCDARSHGAGLSDWWNGILFGSRGSRARLSCGRAHQRQSGSGPERGAERRAGSLRPGC